MVSNVHAIGAGYKGGGVGVQAPARCHLEPLTENLLRLTHIFLNVPALSGTQSHPLADYTRWCRARCRCENDRTLLYLSWRYLSL